MLESKYGKLINSKPFIDDKGIINNKQQKRIKQIADITDEEGLKNEHMKQQVVYISIIISFLSQAQRTSHKTK